LVGAELERLKQQVIFNIRDNADREREVNSLDLKIALLIKNRASLEDVVASTRQYRQRLERAPSADPANLKALDKDTRDKLEVRRL
jgi:Ras GTPase-activating-like protein IQGAP2/3